MRGQTGHSKAHVRSGLKALGLVTLVVALSACTLVPRRAGIPGAHGWRPILPALHAEPDPVAGGRIVDALGREVLLRGVNVNALTEYWQYGSFPTTFPLTGADADRISAAGWNVVRLLVSWSRIEPAARGVRRRATSTRSRAAVDLFERRGVYTIIDFHQDAWGPTLAAPPARPARPDRNRRSAGTEPPDGRRSTAARRAAHPAAFGRSAPAVLASFAAFWNDAPGPGGVGIRTRYARMVGHVERALRARTRRWPATTS